VSAGITECVRIFLVDDVSLIVLLLTKQPEETVHPASRQFYENEVFKTGIFIDQ